MTSDVLVVIRSSGERTEEACCHLLSRQVPDENIVIIHEVPFEAVVAKTFTLGSERGLRWTLAVDADVLFADEAVAKLMAIAEKADENVFEIQGQTLDKFFAGPRPAGHHLFRTSLFAKALAHVPQEGVSLRPESFVMKKMASTGYPWLQEELIVGLHDHEQYYRDIYRKSFVQAKL